MYENNPRNQFCTKDCQAGTFTFFLWLFSIPIDGVTIKCNHENLKNVKQVTFHTNLLIHVRTVHSIILP